MMELITRTARLVPYAKRPKQVPSFVMANVVEPAADDPMATLGSLFIVIEVLLSGRPGEDIASLIAKSFESVYYDQNLETADSLVRFEAATKAANAALGDSVTQGNAAWIGKLSAVIMVQSGDNIHLTHSGSADAYLYRNAASTKITDTAGGRAAGPAKTFGTVASGQLEAGDRLLLATPALIHQIALKRLHDTVCNNTPNTVINELTEQLRGADTARIGALVVEVTTPEMAALQVRTDSPSEIHLGAPESVMDVAKVMASPLTETAVTTSKQAGKAAKLGWNHAKPKLQQAGLAAAKASRAVISGERIARRALIGLIVIAIIATGFIWRHSHSSANTSLINHYEHDYTQYQAALGEPTSTQRTSLAAINSDLTTLVTSKSAAHLKQLLSASKSPSTAPKDPAVFASAIIATLNKLDSLTQVNATTVVSFTSDKTASPTDLELINGTLYAIDTNRNSVFVVNSSTKTSKKISFSDSSLGKIISVTASSNNDGFYLLTNTPAVWFYRLSNNSVSKQSVGLGSWEAGSSISSYNGNLYVLASGQIQKHVRTSTGFTPGSSYLPSATTIPGPSVVCVDGYVYLAGSDGLYQYLSGSVKASVPAPYGLTSLTSLRATSANQLIGVSQASGHIGVWSDADAFTFVGQYQLAGHQHLEDAVYDPAARVYYALSDDQIVSFKPAN